MKTLVIYDSFFGNTEQIAQAIGGAFDLVGDARVVRVGDVKPEQLVELDLLIVASPTRAFRPSPAISKLLKGITSGALEGTGVAAFDTRLTEEEIASGPWILRKMVKIFGYAARPIADRLIKKGGKLICEPEGFFVEGMEGPLKEGEIERAGEWAKRIVESE
jgi:flavodoxin